MTAKQQAPESRFPFEVVDRQADRGWITLLTAAKERQWPEGCDDPSSPVQRRCDATLLHGRSPAWLHSSKDHGMTHVETVTRQRRGACSGFPLSLTPHLATNRRPRMVDGKIRAKQLQEMPWSRHKGRRS